MAILKHRPNHWPLWRACHINTQCTQHYTVANLEEIRYDNYFYLFFFKFAVFLCFVFVCYLSLRKAPTALCFFAACVCAYCHHCQPELQKKTMQTSRIQCLNKILIIPLLNSTMNNINCNLENYESWFCEWHIQSQPLPADKRLEKGPIE